MQKITSVLGQENVSSERKTVDNEVSKVGYSWKEIQKLTQNRRRWLEVSMDLSSKGSERE